MVEVGEDCPILENSIKRVDPSFKQIMLLTRFTSFLEESELATSRSDNFESTNCAMAKKFFAELACFSIPLTTIAGEVRFQADN